ncbi:MAG TPA: phosphotransferase [Sphingomonas sp.]|nr:phosphotransferase [Sphingomonas sp.]
MLKKPPAGWQALRLWGADACRIERIAGGVANDVWRVRVHGALAVGRVGSRSEADLAWEARLLQYLHQQGLAVPVPIPALDGRLFVGGLMITTYMDGEPPSTEDDWRRVADTLRQLHRVTQGWPQRPGWRSSIDLLDSYAGTRIDLAVMPPEAVLRCRAAWQRVANRELRVVHGDPNPGNIRITGCQVALIDWDEAHLDVPEIDLGCLNRAATGMDVAAQDVAAQAAAAWQAAVCWKDDYAIRQLAEVRAT